MKSHGFSLIELLITLLVVSIVCALAIPSFKQHIQRTQMRSEIDNFQQGILLARTKAVSLNQRVTMAHKGKWSSGWDIFVDSNHNGKADEGEMIILSLDKQFTIDIRANSTVKDYVSFAGDGRGYKASGKIRGGFQVGTFTICLAQETGMQLILARGGRVRLVKSAPMSC